MKILIVDDDSADRQLMQRALRKHHPKLQFFEAETCAKAREVLEREEFDAIFLDYYLPDGDGLDYLIEMRASEDITPVIVLTGQGSETIAVEVMRAGATDYLPKADLTAQLLDHCLRGALRYHQSQEQVRRAHESLVLRDRAIAAANNGIVITDPRESDCPIIYANPAFYALTGYAPEETIGRNCRFLQGPGTDAEYIQQLREALHAERECQVILKNYRKDGTLWWNALSVAPVRDTRGRLTHFIGVQTDITKRREAEEAAHTSAVRQQALLRDMFSSVTDGKLTLCGSAADLPHVASAFHDPIPLSATGGIRELRQQTINAGAAACLPDERRYDLETAVGEAAMNAVVHAGTGTGQVCLASDGMVQVWIRDAGKGISVENLPNATLRRGFSSAGTMGHGFKMILQTVDRVFLLTGLMGTTVVIEQERHPVLPKW